MQIKEFISKLQSLPDSKKKIILWTIVVVLATVMGFFWLKATTYRLSKLGEEVKKIEFPRIETQISNIEAEKNETADRKIYKNDEYGFEFEYPSYARVEIENGDGFIAAVFSASIISPNDNKNIIFPTTVRVYTKKDTPDLYNSADDQDTEYLKIIKKSDFSIQIFANEGADIATLEMVKSTFKFIE